MVGTGVEVQAACNFFHGGDEWIHFRQDEILQQLYIADDLVFCRAHCRPGAEECVGWAPAEGLKTLPPYSYVVHLDIKRTPKGLGLDRGRLSSGLLVLRVGSHSCCEIYNRKAQPLRDRICPGDIVQWVHNGLEGSQDIDVMEDMLCQLHEQSLNKRDTGELKMHMLRPNSFADSPIVIPDDPEDPTTEFDELAPDMAVLTEVMKRTSAQEVEEMFRREGRHTHSDVPHHDEESQEALSDLSRFC
jgi:hypothetical protein